MLILATLHSNGTMRFSDIHRSIGDISHRMLAVTLRSLESLSLIDRNIYAEVPPRVEYYLTATGESFIPHLQSLLNWAAEHIHDTADSEVVK